MLLLLSCNLGRGELGVVVAPTGVGKSHFLVQMGAEALRAGKNVVHYTFELSETAVGLRYDSNLCEISSSDVIDRKEEVLEYYKQNSLGRLIIKEYPTGTPSVQTIRNHIREGKITPIRVGKSIIITEKEIDKRRKRNEYKRV